MFYTCENKLMLLMQLIHSLPLHIGTELLQKGRSTRNFLRPQYPSTFFIIRSITQWDLVLRDLKRKNKRFEFGAKGRYLGFSETTAAVYGFTSSLTRGFVHNL
jgi:hypothetical protein